MLLRTTSSDIERRLLEAFRRCLPLVTHPRGRLRARLMRGAQNRGSEGRCTVTHVFDAGETFGLMCQLEVGENEPSLLVTPITELSFDRKHPLARDVADYRRRRAQIT